MKMIYEKMGEVIHGKAIGRTIGMPTANLDCTGEELPALGVYVSQVEWEGKCYPAVTHIGLRPTVDDRPEVSFETHLLSFDGDLYGQMIRVTLLKMLREPVKFASLEALKAQLERDCASAADYFAQDNDGLRRL